MHTTVRLLSIPAQLSRFYCTFAIWRSLTVVEFKILKGVLISTRILRFQNVYLHYDSGDILC